MDQSKKSFIKHGICMVLFFDILVSIFAPIEFYITNKAYFFFSGKELLPFAFILFFVFLASGGIFVFLLSFVNRKISTPIIGILMGITTALYIIGNFMVVNYGAMDGLIPRWERFKKEGIIQTSTAVAIPIIFLLISVIVKNKEKVLKIFATLALCLTGVLLFTLVSICITTGIDKDPEYIITRKGEFDLSKDQNVIVFIIDTYDSVLFDDMFRDDHDKYAEMLSDFTYYPDTSSMYAATELAIPHIITGISYHNEQTYGDYLKYAFNNSKLLDHLSANKYSTGLFTICRMPQEESSLRFDNVQYIKRTVSSHRRLEGYMYKFLGFRYMPQPLKKYFWFYPDEMRSNIESSVDESVVLYGDNNYDFDSSLDGINTSNEKKTFRLYHIDGVHPPFSISADFSPSGSVTSIEEEACGIMYVVDHLLTLLKQNNVYDNSAIVIMADHGYFDERSNPLFMIKGVNESHPLEVSDKPLSYEYLQDVLINLCDGMDAKSAVMSDMSETNGRHYYFYSWNKDMKDYAYANTITEYIIPSNVRDTDSYEEINVYEDPE
jgi:hypothetical protein